MAEVKVLKRGQQVQAGGRLRWVDSIDRRQGIVWLTLEPGGAGAQCFAIHAVEVVKPAALANSARAALTPQGDEDEA